MAGVATNHLFLQWVLLAAQMSVLNNAAAQNHPSVLSRKRYAYSLMRKAVADPVHRYSDFTVIGLAVAAIAEARCGGPGHGQRHLAAVKSIIEARGGLASIQTMPFRSIIIVMAAFINLGAGSAAFPHLNALDSAIQALTSSVCAFHKWNFCMRQDCQRLSPPLAPNETSIEKSYHEMRRKALGNGSPLEKFLTQTNLTASSAQKRCQIAILWILNQTLWELRFDYPEATSFLDTLRRNVISGNIPGAGPSPEAITVQPLTVVYILAECAVKFGRSPNMSLDTDACGDGIRRTWNAIDIIELLELATEKTRSRLLGFLSGWLTEDLYTHVASEQSLLSTLGDIAHEIRSRWLLVRSVEAGVS